MTRPALSFVIPVRNDAARLERCLESIRRAGAATHVELIVADNGSSDYSRDVARRSGATCLELPGRPVSQVRNEAVRHATADLIAFVDADHTIGSRWVDAALTTMADPEVSGAGSDYHAPPNATWVQAAYDRLRRRATDPTPTDWLGSGNLVVRRSAFERVGGFDTALESCEDVDLCRKLRAAGGRIMATDAMHSVHHGDPRSLKALFAAELWRGRDNLRVSLREKLTFKGAVGLALAVVHLAAIVVLVAGLAISPFAGPAAALTGLLVLSILAGLRTARMMRRADRASLPVVLQTFVVAAVYDAARALAPLARVGHGVRRKFES